MKLQFSLATLLVCMTVLAVVCASAAMIPVHVQTAVSWNGNWPHVDQINHSPNPSEVARRLAIGSPLALAATLAILWAIRRLKSRRENGPPVG
jgi:hypothetical protein